MREDAVISLKNLSDIDLSDPFFDSLKADYSEFSVWFNRKAQNDAQAFVSYDESNFLQGFLYLKIENGPVNDINPPLNVRQSILKIGTFKINAHGTKLGERFVKKVFDCAVEWNLPHIYVTIFEKHTPLINLLCSYGFKLYGTKETSNGEENVFYKDFITLTTDIKSNYPIVNARENTWLLSVYPRYHTGLFPDSRLNTEHPDIVSDVSFTNSIHKVYVGRAFDIPKIKPGDTIVTYRTAEVERTAYYNSVATSLCSVIETRSRASFDGDESAFIDYCLKHSVFDEDDLLYWFKRTDGPELYAIKMTYNIALPKRIIRKDLIEKVGIDSNAHWALLKLSQEQLKAICTLGGVYEGVIVY